MQDSFNAISDTSSSTISLREYGDVLRRRRAIILQTFVVVLVAGVLVTTFTPPTYRATARLLLEPSSYVINQVSSSDPLADLFRVNNEYSIATQVELLQAEKLRKTVADHLGSSAQPIALPSMSVSGIEGTSIIEVVSEGDNPETVANAPNELLKVYVEEAAGSNNQQLKHAIAFAKGESESAQAKLNAAEQALRDFKTQNNIEDLEKNRDAQIKNVDELGQQYYAIQTEMRVLQTKIASTKKEMAAAGKLQPTLVSPDADLAIQSVDGALSNLEVQRVALLQTNTPENTKVKELDAQRAQLQKRKVELMKNFNKRNVGLNPQYTSFANQLLTYNIDASVLAERAVGVGQALAAARQRLASFPSFEAKSASLQRAYDDAKGRYELFSSKLADLDLRDQTKRDMAHILQKADVPTAPVRPKKAQGIVLAGVLGLFFGLCLALLQELFDDRINTPEEAERVLHLPTLGHIPMIEEEGLRLIRDISTFSPLMEAYRSLRTNINFAAVGTQIRSLVITSSVPAEGKSTTVANLAMAMALDNKRVIVVDADLRRPSLHRLFKIDSSPGLTDILVGTHEVDETIRESGVPGVSVIPAGSPPPNPAELLGSAAMGALLAQLEGKADVVLFDSPPSLAVADGVVLASRANGVILVVGYGETKKTSTKKALEILARANANVLGTVLNRMDGTSSGYYYGKYYVPAADRAVGSPSTSSSTRALPQGPTGFEASADDDRAE